MTTAKSVQREPRDLTALEAVEACGRGEAVQVGSVIVCRGTDGVVLTLHHSCNQVTISKDDASLLSNLLTILSI